LRIRLNYKLSYGSFSLYTVAFIMYFISLFMDDLALSFGPVGKLMRYLSYGMFFVVSLARCKTARVQLLTAACIVFSMGLAVFTRDIYYCAFVIILAASYKQNPKSVFQVSFYLLCVLTITTVLLSIVGVFPNLNTANQNYGSRLSLGFYHSNVLPMVVCYLIGYRFMIKGNSIKYSELLFWGLLSLGVYHICKGRNGLIGSILLIVGFVFYKNKNKFKVLYYASMFSTFLVSVILLILSFLQGKHLRIMYIINKFFTGRLALAYHQINSTGLHFINLMNKNSFTSFDTFVLDSGYLYLAIHYGLFFTLIYSLLQIIIAKKYKYNAIALLVFLVNTITNAIDNDLFSYNMLPFFVLLAANLDVNTAVRALLNKLRLTEKKGFRITDR